MSSILNPELKSQIEPIMGLVNFILSVCGAYAIYAFAGGRPIPVLDVVVPFVLGIIAFFIIRKQLK